MSTYIHKVTPFAYIAEAIRKASVLDACRIFQAVGELAGDCKAFRWAREPLEEYTQPKSVLEKKFLALERQLFSSHEALDFDQFYEFVSTHAQDIDYPGAAVDVVRDITRADEWAIRCAIHPHVDEDGELRRLWLPYLEEQPRYFPGAPLDTVPEQLYVRLSRSQ